MRNWFKQILRKTKRKTFFTKDILPKTNFQTKKPRTNCRLILLGLLSGVTNWATSTTFFAICSVISGGHTLTSITANLALWHKMIWQKQDIFDLLEFFLFVIFISILRIPLIALKLQLRFKFWKFLFTCFYRLFSFKNKYLDETFKMHQKPFYGWR